MGLCAVPSVHNVEAIILKETQELCSYEGLVDHALRLGELSFEVIEALAVFEKEVADKFSDYRDSVD